MLVSCSSCFWLPFSRAAQAAVVLDVIEGAGLKPSKSRKNASAYVKVRGVGVLRL